MWQSYSGRQVARPSAPQILSDGLRVTSQARVESCVERVDIVGRPGEVRNVQARVENCVERVDIVGRLGAPLPVGSDGSAGGRPPVLGTVQLQTSSGCEAHSRFKK